jgi:hypothetical protein
MDISEPEVRAVLRYEALIPTIQAQLPTARPSERASERTRSRFFPVIEVSESKPTCVLDSKGGEPYCA